MIPYIKMVIRVLILSLSITGCNTANTNDKSLILTFNLKEIPKIAEVKLSDLGFVDIEYIPLETNEQCRLPGINKILFGDKYFLIHFFTNVYTFRYDGKFVAKIGTEGRGPNEFTVVHDVDIDIKSQNIFLADGWQKKFYVFSETGEFIKTFRTPIYAGIVFKFTDNGILCYNNNPLGNVENSYNLINSTGIIVKDFPNMYPWKRVLQNTVIFDENLFYRFNNKLFKKEVYSDTVYIFENKNFVPHLVIEHGDKLLTTEARSGYDPSVLSKKFISQKNLFEFGDYIYYEFIYDSKIGGSTAFKGFIGSKKDNTQYLINSKLGLINDLDGGPNICPKGVKDDNTLFTWIEVLELKKLVSSQSFKNSTPKYPEKKNELIKLANSLKETDNPVLVLLKLRN